MELDAYERRVIRLEDSFQVLSVQVARVETQVESLSDSLKRVEEKIDTGFDTMTSSITKLTSSIAMHQTQIEVLQQWEADRKSRNQTTRAWVLSIIAGAILLIAGAIVKAKFGS